MLPRFNSRLSLVTLVLTSLVAACGGSVEVGSTVSAAGDRLVQLDGTEANRFIDALVEAGLGDDSGLVGALNLAAPEVRCSKVVYPGALPRCTVESPTESLAATVRASAALFEILDAHGAHVDVGSLGATNVVATEVICTRPVVPNPQGRCFFKVATTEGDDGRRSIDGGDADRLIQALADSGAEEPLLLGARNLLADKISCSQPVVPNPTPRCQIVVRGQTFPTPATAAKAFMQVLGDHGGSLVTGTVGAWRVEAETLACTRPVVPNPKTTCTFKVAPAG